MIKKDEFREVLKELLVEWQAQRRAENELNKALDELKFYRGIVAGLIIGIAGSLLSSFKALENIIIFGGLGVIVVLLVVWFSLTFGINDKIKEIKGV